MATTPLLTAIEKAARFLTVLLPLLMIAGPAPADIGATLIAVLFLARTAITRDVAWLRERWVQCVLLLWVYICVRNLFLPEMDGFWRSFSWARYFLLSAALAFWVLRDEATRANLMKTLLLTLAFLALDSLWQYWNGTDIFGREAFPYQGSYRLTGPYSKPRVGHTIVWMMFPAVLWCLAQSARRIRIGGIVLGLLCALAIYASGERMALLLLGLGVALSIVFLPRGRWVIAGSALLAVVLATSMTQLNPKLAKRQLDATHEEITGFWESAYGRTWVSSAHIGKAYPLFGIGSKQFQKECYKPDYGPTDRTSLIMRCPMHSHNMYMEWLVEAGCIGLGLFLAVLYYWGRLVVTHWRSWWMNPVATGLLITMAIRLWPASATTSQFVAWSATPFWMVAGWLLALLYGLSSTAHHKNA